MYKNYTDINNLRPNGAHPLAISHNIGLSQIDTPGSRIPSVTHERTTQERSVVKTRTTENETKILTKIECKFVEREKMEERMSEK